MSLPPQNLEAECAVLGAVLISENVLDGLAVDVGLKPEHFYRPQHGQAFAGMLALRDQGRPIDALTLSEETGIEAAVLDEFAGSTPFTAHCREYARTIIEVAMWRARREATLKMMAAIDERDQRAFDEAEASIARSERTDGATSDSMDLASDMFDWLANNDSDAIATPFSQITDALSGGLRRGDVTLVCAWSSIGKSIIVDQILEHAQRSGHSAHLYLNEMSKRDRYARRLARCSSVPFTRILNRPELSDADKAALTAALNKGLPAVGMTDCTGWTAAEIARHIRRHRWDLCAVDLLQRIPGSESGRVGQVDAISRTINNAALQANTHILLVCQLNQERNKGAQLPRPVRRDIRDSGQLANDAANVLFVHREQTKLPLGDVEMYELLNEGSVWLDKARNGQLGGVRVRLNPARMIFDETFTAPSNGHDPDRTVQSQSSESW